MSGIVAIDCHIPFYRISKKAIFDAWGWFDSSKVGSAKGELAFANYDEDSLTMGVNAALSCLGRLNSKSIDRLYFATATSPYVEPKNTAIMSAALDLNEDVVSVDMGGLISSSSALIAANDAVESGLSKMTLVCSADKRNAKPADGLEYLFGHAAFAMVVGENDTIADIEHVFSYSGGFLGYRRTQEDEYPKSWEERWIRDEGYLNHIVKSVNKTVEKMGVSLSDFSKVIYACPDKRTYSAIAKKLRISSEQLEDPLLDKIGYTGNPHTFVMLENALRKAKPNDKIMLVNFSSGVDIVTFDVTERIDKNRLPDIDKLLDTKQIIDNYTKFANLCGKIEQEKGPRGEVAKSAVSVLWRERKTILGLYGSKCKKCGTKVYPPQHVCINPSCGAIDEMEDYRFAEDTGKLFTYTVDNLAFEHNPPAMYGIVDFDNGGRYWFDITDCSPEELRVGMPVKMSFRKKFYDKPRGLYGYFWKAVPIR